MSEEASRVLEVSICPSLYSVIWGAVEEAVEEAVAAVAREGEERETA